MNDDAPSCKHCHRPIHIVPTKSPNFVHVDGPYAGRHSCATEPYGYLAELPGSECGRTCRGSYDEPEPRKAWNP